MIAIRHDRTGDVARLRCDECGQQGQVFLFGRMSRPEVLEGVRRRLRELEFSDGWRLHPAAEDGHLIDLCRKCWKKRRSNRS